MSYVEKFLETVTFHVLDVLLQMHLLFQTPVISHKKVELILPHSLLSVLPH